MHATRSLLPIQLLSDALISQIAAGEVIERPASVVKELVENALDARATRIEVELERGGCGLIRVRDDGIGIQPEEIALALARHATSKIASLDDLEHVATLGFRGEALPSIASVSRLSLVSRSATAAHAWGIEARDAALGAPVPASHPPGTSVEVRDLFFNVPARRKFLRSDATEYQHIVRMLERLALSRFDVAFALVHNGKTVWSLPAAHTAPERLARVAKLCGEDFAGHVIELQHHTESLRLSGWLALPTFSRSQSDLQFAFLNGRYVRDKLLASAVRLAYHDVLFHGRSWKYDFGIRGAFMTSCSARWRRCWRTHGPVRHRRAVRRSIGSLVARNSIARLAQVRRASCCRRGGPTRVRMRIAD
jgi:DNA mismatch repair protein MutL